MNDVEIRPLEDGDGPALAELISSSPDTGRIGVSMSYTADPVRVFRSIHPDNIDFVAVNPEGRIIGTSGVFFEKIRYEGMVLDAAYFHSLTVHPDFRRQGIGTMMADFRVQVAQERYGPEVFIYAHIQTENLGSEKVSGSWSTQIVPGVFQTRSLKPLRKSPIPPEGITVRRVETTELGKYAEGANEFYAEYNFYHTETAEELSTRALLTPVDYPVKFQLAAFSAEGEILAGVAAHEQFRSREQLVVRIPRTLEFVARIAGELPKDRRIRITDLTRPWFSKGNEKAASYMFDWIRFNLSDEATMFIQPFSPKGPFADFPKGRIVSATSVALAGPLWSGTRLMA